MLELYKSIPLNCRLDKTKSNAYRLLLKAFKEETGSKLNTCACNCKGNLRIIKYYLQKKGVL